MLILRVVSLHDETRGCYRQLACAAI